MERSMEGGSVALQSQVASGTSAYCGDVLPKPMSTYAAVTTLTQNIIGAGVLALPYALKSAGLLGGALLLLLVYGLSIFTMGQLAGLAHDVGAASYKGIAAKSLGGAWPSVIELWVLFYNLGICVSYPILLGDFLSDLATDFRVLQQLTKQIWMLASVLLVCLPLSCAPSIGGLKWMSTISVAGIALTVVAVVQRYLDHSYDRSHRGDLALFQLDTFGCCFPILVGAFGAHYNIPALYRELAPCLGDQDWGSSEEGCATLRRMRRVIAMSLTLSGLVYGAVGFFVYANFGAATKGDFTENFRSSDVWLVVVRMTMAFALCANFPLTMICARNAAFNIVLQSRGWVMTPKLRISLTTGLVLFCLFLAIAAGDISVVLSYNGSVFGTPVCYVAPAVMYLQLLRRGQRAGWQGPSALCAAVGVTFGLLGVVAVSARVGKPSS